jgi:hypothetical protein
MDAYTTALTKMDQFLKFKVKMELTADGESDESNIDIAWEGTADLSLQLDHEKGCYTPKIDGNKVSVKVITWTMTSANGDVTYSGPTTFDAPVKSVSLTLCDQNPRLHIVFANFGPPGQVVIKGYTSTSDMFGAMMMAALVGEAATTMQSHGAGTSTTEQMSHVKSEIDAHKGDVSWLTGPQGQADIQKLQSLAAAMSGQSTTASTGKPTTMALMGHDVGVDWTNGSTSVVDHTFELSGTAARGGLKDQLHVTVEQEPQ